jgi:hypothetical protein
MLTANGIKQEISYIYLHALATRLGYSLERTAIDIDSVDATICSRGKITGSSGKILSPKIDVQLKATEQECSGDPIAFRISMKNYDDLRQNPMVPKILIVLFLPRDRNWLNWEPNQIILHGKAFWKSLKGMDRSVNNSNLTLHLSQSQRLTDETIQYWMVSAANREEFAYVLC